VALAFSPLAGRALEWLQRHVHGTKLRRGLLDSVMLCYSYRSNPALLLQAALFSLIAQTLAIGTYILLGRGIGIELPIAAYFVIIPIVFISAMLPISLGGLGVRESALVGLMLVFGVDKQLAIGLSLLYLFTLWLSTLPGALVLLFQGGAGTDALPGTAKGK
jgi:uncharacterized membrane protein YbhN (UPF0104 family)